MIGMLQHIVPDVMEPLVRDKLDAVLAGRLGNPNDVDRTGRA